VQSQKSFRREYKKEAFSMHTRKILLFTVLLLMAPVLATASTARLDGLGVIPTFVDDYANIFAYPVSVTRFPGVVIGELGSMSTDGLWGRGFGLTMGLGQDNAYGVFGMMLRENSWFPNVPDMAGERGTQFDLLWGMNFGKASLGVRLDRTSSELEFVDGPTWSPLFLYTWGGAEPDVNEFNTTGFGLSAEMQVREADRLEATFEYRTLSFQLCGIFTDPDAKLEDKGQPSYSVTGRGFFAMAENMTLVPMVQYLKADYSWEFKSAAATNPSADKTATGITAGIGCKVDVGSFFMFGLGFSQWTDKGDYSGITAGTESYEFKSTSLPFFFGCLETPVKDWLTVRFGARKNLINQDVVIEDFDGTKVEYKSKNGIIPMFDFVPPYGEPFCFSMGLGFKFGDLDLDATLNDSYPFTGMYWLSGVSETPFGRISATYHY